MPQLGNVSEKVWEKRKQNFLRYESVYFLKVEEQRVRMGTTCSKSQLFDAGLVHIER